MQFKYRIDRRFLVPFVSFFTPFPLEGEQRNRAPLYAKAVREGQGEKTTFRASFFMNRGRIGN